MPGKPYTMTEHKEIVNYIKNGKLFKDVSARSMWINLQNSGKLNRTWQSLKETFLRRILPDIHNPYYCLTPDEITSFRAKCDLTKCQNQDMNQIKVHAIIESHSTDGTKRNSQSADENKYEDRENKGKSQKLKNNIDRHSIDTLVLSPEDYYENANEIVNILEEDVNNEEVDKIKQPTKTLRDCINYTEPLTPMLQEILHDFDSDATPDMSDHEPEIPVVEDAIPHMEKMEASVDIVTDLSSRKSESRRVSCDLNNDTRNSNKNNNSKSTTHELLHKNSLTSIPNNNEVKLSKTSAVIEGSTKSDIQNIRITRNSKLQKKSSKSQKTNENNEKKKNIKKNKKQKDESQNAKKETIIPNNQEALNCSKKITSTLESLGTFERSSPSKTNIDQLSTSENAVSHKRSKVEISSVTHNDKSEVICATYNSEAEILTNANTSTNQTVNCSSDLFDPINTSAFIAEKVNEKGTQSLKNVASQSEIITLERQENICRDNNVVSDTENSVRNATYELPANTSPTNREHNQTHTEVNGNLNSEDTNLSNPCLQSISLYDEQVSLNITEKELAAVQQNIETNKVILLNSNSDSDSDSERNITRNNKFTNKLKRKDLSGVFGLSKGGRIRKLLKKNIERTSIQINSDTNDSSSESEEYVTIPYGGKRSKKYIKPPVAKFKKLEIDGDLSAVINGKIYPIINMKDDKLQYVSFPPATKSRATFWKEKYNELKMKCELARVTNSQLDSNQEQTESSPILGTLSLKKRYRTESTKNYQTEHSSHAGFERAVIENNTKAVNESSKDCNKKVQITFSKGDKTVILDGHWEHVNPILSQVINMIDKNDENLSKPTDSNAKDATPCRAVTSTSAHKLTSHENSPSVDKQIEDYEVHEKVNKLEQDIFKQIEDMEKEQSKQAQKEKKREEDSLETSCVTKGSTKRCLEETSVGPNQERRNKKKKITREMESSFSKNSEETATSEETSRVTSRPLTKIKEDDVESYSPTDDESIKYMLASPQKSHKDKSANSKSKPSNKVNDRNLRRTANKRKVKTVSTQTSMRPIRDISPEASSILSIESTQGYKDSDISPSPLRSRARRKLSLPTKFYRNKRNLQRGLKSLTNTNKAYSNTNNNDKSSYKKQNQEPCLKSNVMSRSNQMLMSSSNILQNNAKLEMVDYSSKTSFSSLNLSPASQTMRNNEVTSELLKEQYSENTEIRDSNNESLSPAISLVENISINNSLLCNDTSVPQTLNEVCNTCFSSFKTQNMSLVSQGIDISYPLMDQECHFIDSSKAEQITCQSNCKSTKMYELSNKIDNSYINKVTSTPMEKVQEQLIEKMKDTNSFSESLSEQMQQLLLQSGKKISKGKSTKNTNDMLIGGSNDKRKSKKRCSTPSKKQTKKHPSNCAVIDEHMEFCTFRGRKSCPTPICYFDTDENNTPHIEEIPSKTTIKVKKPKLKNIIKVKIMRPTNKKKHERSSLNKRNHIKSTLSLQDGSSIDQMEAIDTNIKDPFNETVPLIHNHSETCLQVNTCLEDDSIAFVEYTASSIISLDSNSLEPSECEIYDEQFVSKRNKQTISLDCFSDSRNEKSSKSSIETANPSTQVNESISYFSPPKSLSPCNSLMTEDLTDKVQSNSESSNWYVSCEDERSNPDAVRNNTDGMLRAKYGSHISQLFPMTNAVPNLSTITELSRDTDAEISKKIPSDNL